MTSFQDLPLALSKKDGLIVKCDGVAGLLRGHGEHTDA